MPEPLGAWFDSYAGRGRGEVTRDGFVEPYQGDLVGAQTEPRVVILGLNPGRYVSHLQSRTGAFANEIRRLGSYSTWVRTHPYDRDPWLACHGPNRFYRGRLEFTRRWLRERSAGHNDMLLWELYPWHSSSVTAAMRPPADVITEFVWQPISELGVHHVFAFGAPWARLAEQTLRLEKLAALGYGGENYGSRVASRSVQVFRLNSEQLLVTESHAGSAGPPSADEVERLRDALDQYSTR